MRFHCKMLKCIIGIGLESPLRVRVKRSTVFYTIIDPHTFTQCRLHISRARTFLLAAKATTLPNFLAMSATTFLWAGPSCPSANNGRAMYARYIQREREGVNAHIGMRCVVTWLLRACTHEMHSAQARLHTSRATLKAYSQSLY